MLAGIQGIDVYIDDIVICNDSWEDNLLTLQKVFDRICLANFTISLVKSEFYQALITYLGHVIWHWMVSPLNAKVQDIMRYPIPDNVKNPQRFLDMADNAHMTVSRCDLDPRNPWLADWMVLQGPEYGVWVQLGFSHSAICHTLHIL